jgi:molybdenum cofactor synthesis domain-containing protein
MIKNPTVAILVIGNEVLSGRIADVNVNYICRRCADVGLDVCEVRMVRDDEAAIGQGLSTLRNTYSYVFTTGGIGPTHDDITIASIAKAFGVAVVRNVEVEQRLREHYGSRLTPAALRMADYPAGARIVPHGESFAPSCLMENIAILAGQPRIMQLMFEATLPLLQTGTPLHTRQVDVWGMESQIAEKLGAIQGRFAHIDIGSYPYRVEGRAGTALVCRGEDAQAVEESFQAVQALVAEAGLEVRG